MDVALHRLPVTFVLDRAGVTGDDGPSHNGMWDLSMLQLVPGLSVAAPRDAATLRAELREALALDGPTVVRFPKASVGPDIPAVARVGGMDVLRARRRRAHRVWRRCAGVDGARHRGARLADHGIEVTVVDPRWG